MLGTEKPIFIVGCTNSGTKCLFRPLLEHPDVGGFTNELHWYGIQPNLDGRLNRLFALFPCFNTNFAHEDMPVSTYGCGPLQRGGVEGIIKGMQQLVGEKWIEGKRLLFKDPKLALRLSWLKKLWPDCIIIAMIRNPWAVVEGIIRKLPVMGDVALNLDVPTAMAQWINVNTILQIDSRKIGDFHWVRYEDLIRAKKFPDGVESNCVWSRLLAHCHLQVKSFTIPNKSEYSRFEDGRSQQSYANLLPWEREFISTAGKKLIEDFDFKPPEG